MATLAELRAKSQANLQKMREKSRETGFGDSKDDRFWSIKRGKDGNAYAVIRFLPISKYDTENHPEAALPWEKIISYSFKNEDNGRWYIEKSPSTIGLPDPVGETNRKLYNTKLPADEAKAKKQKRKTSYYSNIYVIQDPSNPDNEGKVFLWSYGQKIHDKIKAILDPEAAFNMKPGDPFNFDTGRDFQLRVRTVDDWPNYELATFDNESPIHDKTGKPLSDEQIEAIWEQSHSLKAFLDPKEFKSFDDLQKKYDWVMGIGDGPARSSQQSSAPRQEAKPAQAPKAAPAAAPAAETSSSLDDEAEVDFDSILAGLED